MARNTRKNDGPALLEVDDDGVARPFNEEDPDTSLEADQDNLLEQVLAEFDKTADDVTITARITRVMGANKEGIKEPYLFSVDAANIHGVRDRLRDEYGGGTYRIRVYRNNRIIRQMDYQIEAPKIAKSNLGGDVNATDRIIQVMQENQRMMRDDMNKLIEVRTNAPAVAAVDPMTLAMTMMEKFSVMIKNMMPVHTPAEASGLNSVDTLIKGMELAQGMSGGNESDSVGAIVKEFVKNPSIGTALTNILAKRPGQQKQNAQAPQPQLPRPAAQPTNEKEVGDQLTQAVRYLIGRAALNKDPALYAEWLLDNLPPEFAEKAIPDPNLLDNLTPHFPRLTQYRGWFEELLREANALMVGENIPESEGENGLGGPASAVDASGGRTDGDTSNPKIDGAAG